jgi:two-component system cell cycle response regulator
VEDDERDAVMIRNIFSGEPYEIERVESGEEALMRLGQEPFDLVLLDVLLPGLDGFDVCKHLKGLHQTRETQIVLITALSDLNNKLMGVESGADDYLIKPINGRELKVRVKVLLKKKRYLDQLCHKVEAAVHSSIHDGLTGLHNQTYFKKFLELEIKRAERQKYPIGLVIIDIDDFKKINDQLGHLTGDLIVRELAQLVKQSIREIDLSARYGGDEFAVVFPYASRGEVAQIVERLQNALAQWRSLAENPLGQEPLAVSFSMGVAFYPDQGATLAELIRKADEALYRAKKEGKNRCCFSELDR